MTLPELAIRMPATNRAPAMIKRSVSPEEYAIAAMKRPTTINGNPIDAASPTWRIGPKLSDRLQFQLCLRRFGRRLKLSSP